MVRVGGPLAWPTPLMACTMAATPPACEAWRPWPVPGTTHLSSAWGLRPPWRSARSLSCTRAVEGNSGPSPLIAMAPTAARAEAEEPAVPLCGAPPPDGERLLEIEGTEAPGSGLTTPRASLGAGATSFFGPAGISPCCCFRAFSLDDGVAIMPDSLSERRERGCRRRLGRAPGEGVRRMGVPWLDLRF